VTITTDAKLGDAARLMRDQDVSLVLVDAAHEVVSVISERDLTRALAEGHGPDAPVTLFAASGVLTVSEDATVHDAAALMVHYGIRHLVVVHGREPIGVISMRDALAALVREDQPELFVSFVHQALTPRPECWWG
jgi:CBS domain-containing protein